MCIVDVIYLSCNTTHLQFVKLVITILYFYYNRTMEKNFSRPPAATSVMFYPEENNIVIVGREDDSILIYGVQKDMVFIYIY